MERVAVRSLLPGKAIEAPLYDRRKNLLLAKGHVLTAEMWSSLLRSGTEHAYLGEWNPADLVEHELHQPLSNYRAVAEEIASTLASKVAKDLDAETELDVKPEGPPLDESVDASLQTERDDAHLRAYQETRREGVALIEDIVQGRIFEDQTAQAARVVIEKMINAFTKDLSLLANLTNLKSSDKYLYAHSFNVAVLAINIAAALQFERSQVSDVGVSALIQDLGMAMAPAEVVLAPRKLSPSEFIDIQKHSIFVLHTLSKLKGLPNTARFVAYQNHERSDGSGYPQRRERQAIHRYARIVAVADTYDAMTTDRPWRKAIHPYRVMEHLIWQANKGKFDSDAVRGLLRYLSLFPVGTLVRLTTGDVAKVVHSNGNAFDRPIVSVLFDADGERRSRPEIVDLLEQEQRVRIDSVIEEDFAVDLNTGF